MKAIQVYYIQAWWPHVPWRWGSTYYVKILKKDNIKKYIYIFLGGQKNLLSGLSANYEILKMMSHEPIMQSIIDWCSQTDDLLWKSSRFPTLVFMYVQMIYN